MDQLHGSHLLALGLSLLLSLLHLGLGDHLAGDLVELKVGDILSGRRGCWGSIRHCYVV